jgi:hypothetical protein
MASYRKGAASAVDDPHRSNIRKFALNQSIATLRDSRYRCVIPFGNKEIMRAIKCFNLILGWFATLLRD